MSSLNKDDLVRVFSALGAAFCKPDKELIEAICKAEASNAWFTTDQTRKALAGLGEMLNKSDLEKWLLSVKPATSPQKIGLILAGNIPLVGFHDILCVLVGGNTALIKMSSNDQLLIPAVLKLLTNLEPAFSERIIFVEQLKNFDAIIAAGSNNSSRYFNYYFSKAPNIIRKNRNSVAVLTGNETPLQIAQLGHDIFDFFGLGCRNVSKVYFPKGYDLKNLLEPLEKFQPVINHFKYGNNYDYNKSIYLINRQKHFDNGFLLIKEDQALTSPLAVLFYEEYEDLAEVENKLNAIDEQIQCVVAAGQFKLNKKVTPFGQSQHPKLWDYADNVNTISFLNSITS